MANGTTDNTAVNRLIDLAQQRPVEADDTLFESQKRIPLPPPFRARGASSTRWDARSWWTSSTWTP